MHADTSGRPRLAWREAGKGRPVVLIHCYPVDSRLFDAQLAAAAAGRLGARVVAPDLPGFGRSPVAQSASSRTADLAAAIDVLIEHLELRDPVIGGVAIGGTIAAMVAARLGNAAALVLIGNKAGTAPLGPARSRERVAEDAMRSGSPSVAAELTLAALGPLAPLDIRRRVEAMISEADPRGISSLASAISLRPDLASIVPPLDLMTLLVAGSEDRISPLGEVRRLAALLPHTILLEVAGAGHMVPIEAPDAMTGALESLLARLGDSSSNTLRAERSP